MPNGGTIKITAERLRVGKLYAATSHVMPEGDYLQLSVSDNGSGIPKEHLAKIFDPFFTTKDIGKGTGLGLATVHTIVKSHGGFIDVYSELGKGTVFKIYFPLYAHDASAELESFELEEMARGNGEWILLVDDEVSILDITRQTLEAYGYNVLTASNGAQAVSVYALHQAKIAVVLTDMAMPIMDGPTTIIALQQINPKVKVIAASGLEANGAQARVLAAGVKLFLTKPFTAASVLNSIKRALSV
jgi:CheY-like chemotaxis protein